MRSTFAWCGCALLVFVLNPAKAKEVNRKDLNSSVIFSNRHHVVEARNLIPEIVILARNLKTEILCLATAIYFETSGGSTRGKIAVAKVVTNRMQHPAYDYRQVCDTVWQDRQFDFTRMHRRSVLDNQRWQRDQRVAFEVYKHPEIPDPTRGATQFHAQRLSFRSDRTTYDRVAIDGNVFFKVKPPVKRKRRQ